MFAAALLIVAALDLPHPGMQGRTPDTDQTVAVTRGARLTVENFGGEVVVRTWPRDEVRVQASHGRRAKIAVRTTAAGVVVSADQSAPGSVDYRISIPAWMSVRVNGTYAFIDIEAGEGEVVAETTRGDVIVKGGSGTVTAKSIMGDVVVENAKGRVTASSVNEDVRLTGVSGDIIVESNNGDIQMSNIRATSIDASTINGDITFEGPPADRGRYRFATHNGDIVADVPPASSVTFDVRSYQGRLMTNLDLQGPPRSEVQRGRRSTYTLGS
jgi:hypothetical protein